MQQGILFWEARIKLTQAPENSENKEIQHNLLSNNENQEDIQTFLYDPIGSKPYRTYGLDIKASKRIDWTFFTKTSSQLESIEIGNTWLSSLKYRFRGLDGVVKAKPIKNDNFQDSNGFKLFEIVLPEGVIRERISLTKRFIATFFHNNNHKVRLKIFWKRAKEEIKTIEFPPKLYFIRIFLEFDSKSLTDVKIAELKGILRLIFTDIEDGKRKRAVLRNCNDITQQDFTYGDAIDESNAYSKIIRDKTLDFNFPKDLPLPKVPILDKEKVRYIDIKDDFIKKAIRIGYHIKNGVITNKETYIPINKLPQDLVIFGKSGSGKTYFLAGIIKELCKKAKNVGIIVLNVAKESQHIYYEDFKVIKYTDDNFHIPYFIRGSYLEKSLQETASYICASLGLKNVFEKIIYRCSFNYVKNKEAMPKYIIELLEGVKQYIKNNPYGSEVQANLIQALNNRINIFKEKKTQDVLKLTPELPQWINEWLNGEKIFLDLSMCNKYTKAIVVNALFQCVRMITKDIEAEELKHLIVIDEAHAILEKPITTNPDDTDFIMKEQMSKIFSELLKEYRSRGVGFIIVDQSPSKLFDDVASQPSIKVIFRQDYPNNVLFSEDPKERQMLTQLENRLALMINGAIGEKFLIKSLDYSKNLD